MSTMIFLLFSCVSTKNPEDTGPVVVEELFPEDESYRAVTEEIFSDMQSLGAASGAVAIFNADGVIHCDAFGTAPDGGDLEPDAQFRMGSLTKVLTSLLNNQQIEAGLYNHTDKVVELLPDLQMPYSAEHFAQITVEDLLTHRGGFLDYLEIDGTEASTSLQGFMQNILPQLYIMAEPGLFFNYSNPNFYLAGYLAEQMGGESYRDLMDSVVFTPLGMADTTFSNAEVIERGKWGMGLASNEEITPEIQPAKEGTTF